MRPVLELHHVSCRFVDGGAVIDALSDVCLRVDEGELVAVMGPSGSGKSTLIHLACGLLSPSAGQVGLLGREVPPARRRREWADLRRHTIGVVHQRLNLVPGLTALENVALPLRLDGCGRNQADVAAAPALAEVDGVDLGAMQVERLSLGQQQRVALARATVGRRRLLLADEPTANLDTVGAEQIVRLLARLAHAGKAVLMVTHDSRLASWADRVVVLRDGRVVDTISQSASVTDPGEVDDPGASLDPPRSDTSPTLQSQVEAP